MRSSKVRALLPLALLACAHVPTPLETIGLARETLASYDRSVANWYVFEAQKVTTAEQLANLDTQISEWQAIFFAAASALAAAEEAVKRGEPIPERVERALALARAFAKARGAE